MKLQAVQLRKDLKALKAEFPNTKFSVTSEISVLRVNYTDGPCLNTVKAIAEKYESIDRDDDGSILAGGNDYVFVTRQISHTVRQEFLDTIYYMGIDSNDIARHSAKYIELKQTVNICELGLIVQEDLK